MHRGLKLVLYELCKAIEEILSSHFTFANGKLMQRILIFDINFPLLDKQVTG